MSRMKKSVPAAARFFAAALALALLLPAAACSKKGGGVPDMSGTPLDLAASSDYFDMSGEHVLTYELLGAVQKRDGSVVLAHGFTNHSELRVTLVICEFYYYGASGEVVAHKQLTRDLSQSPIAPGGTYTYYSTLRFDGAAPDSMSAHVIRADTELETPVLPKPNPNSAFFDFFTDGRYDGLPYSFASNPPAALVYTKGDESITVTDARSIESVLDALKSVRVGGESASAPSGGAVRYTFIMPDGSEYTVSFEGGSLIRYGSKYYETGGTEKLFSLVLKEESYSQEAGDDYEQGLVG